MLVITPKIIFLLLVIFTFVIFANYPILMILSSIYFLLISPNYTAMLLILGLGFILLIFLESMGEKWWRGPYFLILLLFGMVVGLRLVFHVDLYRIYGPTLREGIVQLHGLIYLFLSYIFSFFQALFKVGFTVDFIIKVVIPFYILYHICLALWRYTAIFSPRTATFLSIVMAFFGVKGGVLMKGLQWFMGFVLGLFTDPLSFTYSALAIALILMAIDGLIDVLWYVMSVTPEERQAFWREALEGGGGFSGAFAQIARKIRANPIRIKFAKLRTVDPVRIADAHFQTLKFSQVRAYAPTDIDKMTGNVSRGVFSASPVYSAPSFKVFNWLSSLRR